ncbi:ECF RNA polymerase sigma factor SigE [Stieleria varia]|uniref:ECF RNA polymerase sigma factor SigE n=1 Tax=Stieleria varia TaxID=2528005 RepID=A0A5C6B890_9BACT|nr:ECF RNA polymerase sigma factor SigE [Stieleria varia]
MQSSPAETRASLILRLKHAEDVAAWNDFVSIYAPVIFRVACRHGFQNADAENLIQEVLLAISRALPRWLQREDRGSFRAWLLKIARNEAIDMLTRRATRPIGKDGLEAERLLAEVPDPRRDLSSQFDLEYEQAVFQWAAAQVRDSVSDSTWQSFCLTHVEGLSVDMAAKQLNMRTGTVYVARGRVMNRIQELVKQFEDKR